MLMKNLLFCLIIALLTTTCQKEIPRTSWGETDFSKIRINLAETGKYEFQQIDEYNNGMGEYKIWYVGTIKDEILIPSRTDTGASALMKMLVPFSDDRLKMEYRIYDPEPDNPDNEILLLDNPESIIKDSTDMEIFVDTSRILGLVEMDYRLGKKTKPNAFYPVFIKNLSKDSLQLGYGGRENVFLFFTLEAKNELGKWQPVEKKISWECGTGMSPHYLFPKHIAITGTKIYAGDFLTNLRLSLQTEKTTIYSNTFRGKIFKKQFSDPKNLFIQ